VSRYVCRFSGGLSSWAAARRTAERYGVGNVTLLFADTRMEDEDLYRFLIEGAADVLGVPLGDVADLAAAAFVIPAVEDERPAERIAALESLQREATARLPGFVWIADGRDPWQVFFDERYLGNTRVDPCSKLLKRKLLDRWVRENAPGAVEVFGYDHEEDHRIAGMRAYDSNRRLLFPMADRPWWVGTRCQEECRARGIEPPRLYAMGFRHNNCGGFCVKAGQAAMARLLDAMPRRFAYHERREQEIRDYLGKDVAVLRDRTGGSPTALTLTQFRERVQASGQCDLFDWGACSCFAHEDAAADARPAGKAVRP
jgi:hypothetical protein